MLIDQIIIFNFVFFPSQLFISSFKQQQKETHTQKIKKTLLKILVQQKMSHYREKDGQRPVQAVSNSEEAIRNIKPRKGPRGIYPDALVDPERMPSFMQVVKKITFFDWAKAFGIGTVVGAYFCSEGIHYYYLSLFY